VWVFGESYDGASVEGNAAYMRHFESIMWLTYRRGIQGMPNGITSDAGWGCMLRSAQMQLAEALLRHKIGKGEILPPTPTPPFPHPTEI
jgi:cysteine protease ATG4